MNNGIKTFPHPVAPDDKIKLVEAEYGIKGYAVIWKLHEAIFAHGYYMTFDIDSTLLFINDYGLSLVGRSAVSEIVACCLRRGVFDNDLYQRYGILTSRYCQETFLTANKRSKKVIIDERYALPIVYDFAESVNIFLKNANIFLKNADILPLKERKEKNPLTPLRGGSAGSEAKERFLQTYPKLKANIDDSNIDYSLLLTEFEKSGWLRNSYSMKWVAQSYEAIIGGAYRDKIAPVDERGERESWYSGRKAEAERGARAFLDKARCDKDFADSERELRKLDIAEAKAEAQGDEAKRKELMLKRSENETRRKMALERLHIREEDLLPRYHCAKCSDTGYLPSGVPCDCYKEKR